MMSLKELQRAGSVLAELLPGARLQRLRQAGDFHLVLEFHSQGAALLLLLSCDPKFARVSRVREMPAAAQPPKPFAQFLLAHLGRAAFRQVTVPSDDRRLAIRLDAPSESLEIVLSILGARSNIYALDASGALRSAMRPLQQTRRDLELGKAWINPGGAPRPGGADRWEHVPDELFLASVQESYAALERDEEAARLYRRIDTALGKGADSFERKAANLLQDLGETADAESSRRKGELLKRALHSLRRGDETVRVADPETGSEAIIDLDPRLSPSQNLEAYFRRYRKELRGADMLRSQLQDLRDTQAAQEALRSRLRSLGDPPGPHLAELRALADEPQVRRLLARFCPEQPRRAPHPPADRFRSKSVPTRLLPRRFRTDQELEIWVGRSEAGNDYLTTRLANGNDLFFHLEGYPGSHVILRTEGSQSPPPESVLAACELAVHFSRLKDAQRADIHVAPVKNVRKPKGAKPGLVYVRAGKTIHLRRDAARLENILASRLEE